MGKILTVTLNPAIDVFATVDQVLPTRKLRCASERRDPGGGGINVARVAHRLGANVLTAYTSGGIVGQFLEQLIAAEGVTSLPLPVAGDTRESINIFEQSSGREYRFILPGPTLSANDWIVCRDQVAAALKGCGLVVLSGSLPPGAPVDAYAQIAQAAKAAGARVVIDTSGPALKAASEEGVFLIKPNLDELRDLVGGPLESEESWVNACRRLIEAQAAEIVVLSLSARGALVAAKTEAWRADALSVQVVSSIGAGDSFVGAMVWALDAGLPLKQAFRHGVAAGAAALLAPGTHLSTREDIERLLAQVNLRAL